MILIIFGYLRELLELLWSLCYQSAFLKGIDMILKSILLTESKHPVIKIGL